MYIAKDWMQKLYWRIYNALSMRRHSSSQVDDVSTFKAFMDDALCFQRQRAQSAAFAHIGLPRDK